MARILIVDDDPQCGIYFRNLCKSKGHETSIANTLGEGLREIATAPYDLVILDVHLPDGDGIEALPRFRAAESSPTVIIITGLGDPNGAELAIRSGAWDYLQKPVPAQELILAITRSLEYRQVERSQPVTLFLKRHSLAGESPQLLHCLELAARSARSEMNVLIQGETGTGKEVVASIIHNNSPRALKPFVVVDCSSLPENLVESALFGHVKGAFTGATEDRTGLVKAADGGTLFLDEVGELPLPMQKNMLRVLQEHSFRPVGSSRETASNFRLIAASNRDLEWMVREGKFREDLLFRLKTIQIDLPPLRERKEDFYLLMIHFMKSFHDRYHHGIKGIGPDFLEAVQAYSWPGNVRELKSAMEYSYLAAANFPTLMAYHLPPEIRIQTKKYALTQNTSDQEMHMLPFDIPLTLEEFRQKSEAHYLQALALHTQGRIGEAIRISGLSRPRLYALLKQNGISLKGNRPDK